MNIEVVPDLVIPESELQWMFSRSSGPGGQHVNTSDSRVQLRWNVSSSTSLSEQRRALLLQRLDDRLVRGEITITVAEQRSQLRNRETARDKLAALLRSSLAPAPTARRAIRPSLRSIRRQLSAKQQRSATKQQRRRPSAE